MTLIAELKHIWSLNLPKKTKHSLMLDRVYEVVTGYYEERRIAVKIKEGKNE